MLLIRKLLLLSLLSLLCINRGVCQPLSGKADRFTTQDGLPHNTINSICQDKTGFLWVATSNGLCRYDGLSFSKVKIPGVNDNHWSQVVEALYADTSNTMWFGTRSGKVVSWNGRKNTWHVHKAFMKQGDYIQRFYQANRKKLWFVTHSGNLGYYDYESQTIAWKKNFPQNTECLYLDNSNRVWVFGTQFIDVFDTRSDEHLKHISVPLSLSEKITGQMIVDVAPDGKILFCGPDSCLIYLVNGNSIERYATQYELDCWKLDELIWFSAGQVHTFNKEQRRYDHYTVSDFSDYMINDLLKDCNGLLWVATDIGLFKIDRKKHRFKNYSTEEGSIKLDHNYIRALTVSGNDLWLGFKQAPVSKLQYSSNVGALLEKEHYPLKAKSGAFIETPTVNSFLVTRNGNVWCGGLEGLFKMKKGGRIFENQLLKNEDGKIFASDEIWSLEEDSRGRVWIGGRTIGLWVIDEEKESTLRVLIDAKKEISVWNIHKDKKGVMWVGTSTGLFYIQEEPTAVFNVKPVPALKGRSIWDIKSDENGNYFIASTDWGFSIYHKYSNTLKHYTIKEGLPSNSVCGVEIDDMGNAWLSTANGLCCLNYEEVKVTNYYEEDGLVSNDFNFSVNDKSPWGELFFGTKNGLLSFHPFYAALPSSSAQITVNSFRVNGEEMIDSLINSAVLELNYNKNNLDFRFSLLEYSHPLKNRYQYKLEPFDAEWKQTSGQAPLATYTNLPPASYIFKLKASVDGVNWQQNGTLELPFSIKPALWQRIWFTPLVCIIVIGLLGTILYMRFVAKLKAERNKHEINKKIALLELQALQAQMNPHFIFNAINSVQDFMLADNLLAANDYLTRFAHLMRFFLEASIQKRVRLSDEVDMLKLYTDLEMLRFSARFDVEINYPENGTADLIEIPAIFIQPYVENAIQHGLATKKGKGLLKVDIQVEEDVVTVIIEDNGIGRKESAKLKNALNENTPSRGRQLLKEREEAFNTAGKEKVRIETEDKYNDHGEPTGTRITITFTDIN